jgi:tetratricopeptide (TPR) repeat protein
MSDMVQDGPAPAALPEVRAAVEHALEDDDLEAATAALERLTALAPDAADVSGLRERVDDMRRRVVQEAVAGAELSLAQGRPRRALDGLTRIGRVASQDAQVARLLTEAQRAVSELDAQLRVKPLVDKARKLAVQGQLDAALATVEEAARLAPNDARALRLRDELAEQAAAARQTAPPPAAPPRPPAAGSAAESVIRAQVRALLASARGSLERNDVGAAERDAEKALGFAPADADANALLAEIRERRRELDQSRRVDTLATDARRLLEAGRFQASLALVAQLVKLDPAHSAVPELRSQAEAALSEAETRRTAIRMAFAEGREALARGDVGRAVERLTTVLTQDPAHTEARRGLAEARARLAQRERIDAMVESARDRLERDAIEAAQRDVQAVLRIEPDNAEAHTLWERSLARVRELRSAGSGETAPRTPATAPPPAAPPLRREVAPAGPADAKPLDEAPRSAAHPQEQFREPLEAAERLIREGRPDRALETLRDLLARTPDRPPPPELARLAAQAERAATERDVRVRVLALVDHAMKLSLQGNLPEALAAAEEAVVLAPADARALRLRDELGDRLRQREKR